MWIRILLTLLKIFKTLLVANICTCAFDLFNKGEAFVSDDFYCILYTCLNLEILFLSFLNCDCLILIESQQSYNLLFWCILNWKLGVFIWKSCQAKIGILILIDSVCFKFVLYGLSLELSFKFSKTKIKLITGRNFKVFVGTSVGIDWNRA